MGKSFYQVVSMNDELAEIQEFWDGFAEEYHLIQEESVFPIAEDVNVFLENRGILPTTDFLDLAGGAGRYIDALLPQVESYTLVDISQKMLEYAAQKTTDEKLRLVRMDQAQFFSATKGNAFSVVFSAMNPVIEAAELIEINRISSKWCLILRTVKEEESLFTPLEKRLGMVAENDLMTVYQDVLKEKNAVYSTQRFSYHEEEVITQAFFREYFQEYLTEKELSEQIETLFQDETAINHRHYVFELLFWEKF